MHSGLQTDTLSRRFSKHRPRIMLAFAIAAAQTIFAAPAIAADYYDALAAYDSQNFGKSFALFSKLAASGNIYAQYALGRHYQFGQGVRSSNAIAFTWYSKAAAGGNLEARLFLQILKSKMSTTEVAAAEQRLKSVPAAPATPQLVERRVTGTELVTMFTGLRYQVVHNGVTQADARFLPGGNVQLSTGYTYATWAARNDAICRKLVQSAAEQCWKFGMEGSKVRMYRDDGMLIGEGVYSPGLLQITRSIPVGQSAVDWKKGGYTLRFQDSQSEVIYELYADKSFRGYANYRNNRQSLDKGTWSEDRGTVCVQATTWWKESGHRLCFHVLDRGQGQSTLRFWHGVERSVQVSRH